jgi:hypothetical protein
MILMLSSAPSSQTSRHSGSAGTDSGTPSPMAHEGRHGAATNGVTRIGRFARVAEALAGEYGFSRANGGGKDRGERSLLIDHKAFASSSVARHFVVRLPTERIDMLVRAGAGRSLRAGGREAPDWLVVHGDSFERWLELAREAMRFVRTLD